MLTVGLAVACSEPTSPFAFLSPPDAAVAADASATDSGTSDTDSADASGGGDASQDGHTDVSADDTRPDDAIGDGGGGPDTTPADTADDVAPSDGHGGIDTPATVGDFIDVAPPGATVVGIATFNVARLFDTVCDTGSCGEDDFEYQPAPAQFDYRLFQIAQGIEMLDVDIVLLQEVEKQVCIDALAAELGDGWNWSEIGETGFNASLDVAVISRFPIAEAIGYRDVVGVQRPDGSSTTFAREFLEVRLDVEGHDVLVFSSHFKSKSNDDAGRRFGEAAAARDIVLSRAAANPNALVVLGGDLNDTPGSDPIVELERLGGLRRAGEVLGDRDGTITYAGERQAIDHLYLATDGVGSILSPEVRVVRDASGNLGGSDHAALRASFVIP